MEFSVYLNYLSRIELPPPGPTAGAAAVAQGGAGGRPWDGGKGGGVRPGAWGGDWPPTKALGREAGVGKAALREGTGKAEG